jgi:CheY-like chemotaxis protein
MLPFMAKSGPIVIVEDDIDDQEIITDALREMGSSNELVVFPKAAEAFKYLKTSSDQQFIIICDINMPGMNGLDFKKQVDDDTQLRQKSIPFIFYSTADNHDIVKQAYANMTVQGFFKKEQSFTELKKTLTLIIDYWKLCRHPNS